MAFSMPSCAKRVSLPVCLALLVWPLLAHSADYSADVRSVSLHRMGENTEINAQIQFRLSPLAQEALLKGVPLEWRVLIEYRRGGPLWDSVVQRQQLPYRLQYHALLNQYTVKTANQPAQMFLTLTAAFHAMSQVTLDAAAVAQQLPTDNKGLLAIKVQFLREALPVPLRPFAYLNPQWFLSSDWYTCPIQK